MNPKLLLRLAVGCILFFAIGHSIGHFTRKSSADFGAKTVIKIMEEYKFPIGSQMRSYDEFYEGMSLNLIITLLTLATILWILSNFISEVPKLISQLLLPILFCMIAFTTTSTLFFFLIPAATCATASILILIAIISINKSANNPKV